jgi:hypothetical protein
MWLGTYMYYMISAVVWRTLLLSCRFYADLQEREWAERTDLVPPLHPSERVRCTRGPPCWTHMQCRHRSLLRFNERCFKRRQVRRESVSWIAVLRAAARLASSPSLETQNEIVFQRVHKPPTKLHDSRKLTR